LKNKLKQPSQIDESYKKSDSRRKNNESTEKEEIKREKTLTGRKIEDQRRNRFK
jgi:hypothetical protein